MAIAVSLLKSEVTMTKKDGEKQIKRNEKGQFAKGKKGGPGRPKKLKGTGRPFEDFITAYETMGGVEELVRWALQNNTNRSQFYSLLMRTIPKETIEKLLLPKMRTDFPLPIRYVCYDDEIARARVRQLEGFIRENGLEVPPELETKVKAKEIDHE